MEHVPNIIDDLFPSSRNLEFSLCFSNSEGGYMVIGGHNAQHWAPNTVVHTIPYQDTQDLYGIKIHGIKVVDVPPSLQIGNLTLSIDPREFDKGHGSFVDSGTTLVYAHDAIYYPFVAALQEECLKSGVCPRKIERGNEICYKHDRVSRLSD
jgi:hypothetical protein